MFSSRSRNIGKTQILEDKNNVSNKSFKTEKSDKSRKKKKVKNLPASAMFLVWEEEEEEEDDEEVLDLLRPIITPKRRISYK